MQYRIPGKSLLSVAVIAAISLPLTAQVMSRKPNIPWTVRAEVVDENGAPVAAAGVRIGKLLELATSDVYEKPAFRTDAKGRLRFTVPVPKPQKGHPNGDDRPPHALLAAKGFATRVLYLVPKTRTGEIDLGRIVLPRGKTLTGLVRGPDGKPVPGARIMAEDVFRNSHLRAIGSSIYDQFFVTTAHSDERGIFKLHGVLERGASVTVRAEGYCQAHIPFANGMQPLVASLQKGGTVSGRVVDEKGDPVAAGVSVTYEFGTDPYGLQHTDARGAFRLPLEMPGRYSVRARRNKPPISWFRSEILEGSQRDVEIEIADTVGERRIVVHVTDAKTGDKVSGIRGVAMWTNPQVFQFNTFFLEGQLSSVGRTEVEPGKLMLPGPTDKQPHTAGILIRAKGYAAHMATDAVFDDEDNEKNVLHVALQPESILSGVVRDQKTGAPVANAKLTASKIHKQANNRNVLGFAHPLNSVAFASGRTFQTDAEGRFEITGLSDGPHQLRVTHARRPDAKPKTIRLAAGEHKKDLDVRIPTGARVTGKLTGRGIQPGWLVRMGSPQAQNNALVAQLMVASTTSGRNAAGWRETSVAPDGTFTFEGLPKSSFQLTLRVPNADGSGEFVDVPLPRFDIARIGTMEAEQFVLKSLQGKDWHKEFDLTRAWPATLKGEIEFGGAALPPGRVLVIAERVNGQQMAVERGVGTRIRGPRCVVGRDREFKLLVPPGRHRLLAVDLATGALLAQSKDTYDVGAGEKAVAFLGVPLALVRVTLQPAKGEAAIASRLQIKVKHPSKVDPRMQLLMAQRSYDTGEGLRLTPGQTEIELFLPLIETELKVRNNAASLISDLNRVTAPPAGELTFTPEASKLNRVTIPLRE